MATAYNHCSIHESNPTIVAHFLGASATEISLFEASETGVVSRGVTSRASHRDVTCPPECHAPILPPPDARALDGGGSDAPAFVRCLREPHNLTD